MARTLDQPAPAEAAPLPRYLQIMLTLRERIQAGVYPLQTLMPTEAELCTEFSVSRYTVREALRRLADQGLVARRKGAGTLVVAVEAQPLFSHSMRSLTELFEYALTTDFEIARIGLSGVGADEAAQLGCATGAQWLRVTGLRRVRPGGPPICHTTVLVHDRFAWLAPEMPGCRGPIYALVERRAGVPVAEAVQTARAMAMPPAIATQLGEVPGGCAMRMERRYLDAAGATMLMSLNLHPAGRFSYAMRIRRDGLA
ncbi:MAG: GntR family transcriptional regulator [Thermohalobaculum sp.]|nr:GntR family transcriptional regulator [Thermohalobaculum sp.]